MLSYNVYFPSDPLKHFIHSYHFISGKNVNQQILPSMNRSFIMINYGDPMEVGSETVEISRAESGIYIGGVYIYPRYIKGLVREMNYVAIVLNPDYAGEIFQENVSRLVNSCVPIQSPSDQKFMSWLPEALDEKSTNEERFVLLEETLIGLLNRKNINKNPFIEEITNMVYRYKGNIDISKITEIMGYSERSVRRKVLESIGVPPSQFCKTVRINYAISKLIQEPNTPIMDLVFDLGYYDQAHLINDFRHSLFVTPRQLVNSIHSPELNTLMATYQALDINI